MWILTTTSELVNADQVSSIRVKKVTDTEYTSGGASIVDKKALIADLSNGSTSRLATFDEDVTVETINAYTNVIKHGISTNVTVCDLSSVRI